MEKMKNGAEDRLLEKNDWLWNGDYFDAWTYDLAKSYEPRAEDEKPTLG